MKTIEEQMVVMQAYADGKRINRTNRAQHTMVLDYFFTDEEGFNWEDFDYDIVEEPVVRYEIVDKSTNNTVSTFSNEKAAIRHAKRYGNCRVIKMVQDMDYGEQK